MFFVSSLPLSCYDISKQIISLTLEYRKKCLSVMLISPQRGTVKLRCKALAAFREVEWGLTVYLQLLIARNEMPSGADQPRRLRRLSAIFKPPSNSPSLFVCWGTPALNGTLSYPFISWWKFITYRLHVFQAYQFGVVDKIHTARATLISLTHLM